MSLHTDPPDDGFDDAVDAQIGRMNGAIQPDRGQPPRPAASEEELDAAEPQPAWDPPTVIAVPGSWYSTRPPKRAWLLRDTAARDSPGVFPLGKVGQVIAAGGGSKTMVNVQLVVAVSTGTAWLGRFQVPPEAKGRALLVLGEEDAEESQRRLYYAVRAGHAPAPDDGGIVVLPLAGKEAAMLAKGEYGNLQETPFLRWLRDYIKAEDFRLVVVDPLSRFGGPEVETDNAAATRFMQALESCTSPTCSLINSHHTNKLSRGAGGTVDASSGRGSTALFDGARWQAALSVERLKHDDPDVQARLGEVVTFTVTKSNYAIMPEPVSLRRDRDNGGALLALDDPDRATVACARQTDILASPKKAARASEAASEVAAIDAAVLAVVGKHPGINQTELRAKVRGLTLCGDPAARASIARLEGASLTHSLGPSRAKLYQLRAPS